jgi:hypothetical protein
MGSIPIPGTWWLGPSQALSSCGGCVILTSVQLPPDEVRPVLTAVRLGVGV